MHLTSFISTIGNREITCKKHLIFNFENYFFIVPIKLFPKTSILSV